jgi:ABC-2 type transport system ATP-binding protein
MIKVTNLVKNYGDFQAVRDISFDVDKGEIFAFLGPNGAGKTTTIKILTTLLKPTSGTVELDGLGSECGAQRSPQALRHRVPGPQPG